MNILITTINTSDESKGHHKTEEASFITLNMARLSKNAYSILNSIDDFDEQTWIKVSTQVFPTKSYNLAAFSYELPWHN